MIELRRRYSGSKGSDSPSFSRLPAGYQEVEYLENTYDARLYFPVDFQTNDIISVETSFMITGRFSLYYDMCIIGVGGVNKFALTISRNGNSFRYEVPNYPDRKYVDIYNNVAYDTEYSIKINTMNGSYVNDNLITNEVVKGNDYYSGGVYIFNRGPLFQEPFLGKLKELVLKTTTDTFHFIPCYRISDRKPGMYDIVNDVFYTNAGNGEFLVGQDVHYNIPPEYQQVEYLEKNNINPYIKLGIKIKADKLYSTRVDFEFSGNRNGNQNAAIDGYYGTSPYAGYPLYSSVVVPKNENRFTSNLININTKSLLVGYNVNNLTERHVVEFNTSDGSYIDGVKCSSETLKTDSDYDTENSFLLFTRGAYDGAVIVEHFLGKIYSYTFYEDGVPIRNLIPCYRKSDNEAGMYDLVSGEFYTNAGTGKFDVGLDVIG